MKLFSLLALVLLSCVGARATGLTITGSHDDGSSGGNYV